jgi:type IV secretion system protein VirD4
MTGTEQRLYFALAGAAAALLALLWLSGALAGLLFGSGWAPLGFAELVAAALRLPSHLTDPGAAWPAGARAALPGPLGFYATGALVLGALSGVILALRRAIEPFDLPRLGFGGPRPPSARWATRGELAPLRVPGPQPGRLTLGRHGRALLAAEERQSAIVFAPTETHKTSGLAIPALLEWQGPALVTSVKGDLLAETISQRRRLGRAMIFDPARVSGEPRARATPLAAASSWRGAMRVAHWLCAGARSGAGGLEHADFWLATAEKLLAPLLFAAAQSERTMGHVVAWLDEGSDAIEAEVEDLLAKAGEPAAERAWRASKNREERQRASVYTTAEMVIAAFADERVMVETADADYTPEALLGGRANTLYLCAPVHEQERLRGLFAAIVQELMAAAYESAALRGRLDPPLLLLLDEAANIAPVPNLDEIASTGAGQGIQLLSVFQDMAQVKARYGGRAATIVNNHRAKLFGTGISDPETLSYVSRLLGTARFEQRSRNTGERGRRSHTEGETYRDLAPANLVREREPGSALLVYGSLPPAKIRLRPWFEDAELVALRGAPPRSDSRR